MSAAWGMYIQFTLTYALLTVTLLVYMYLVSEFVYLTQRDSIPKCSSSVCDCHLSLSLSPIQQHRHACSYMNKLFIGLKILQHMGTEVSVDSHHRPPPSAHTQFGNQCMHKSNQHFQL